MTTLLEAADALRSVWCAAPETCDAELQELFSRSDFRSFVEPLHTRFPRARRIPSTSVKQVLAEGVVLLATLNPSESQAGGFETAARFFCAVWLLAGHGNLSRRQPIVEAISAEACCSDVPRWRYEPSFGRGTSLKSGM
jgi:hypothetical protein